MKNKIQIVIMFAIFAAMLLVACGGSAEPTYAPELVSQGEGFFAATCSACHGPDAKGLPNLGKDLTTSEYVRDSSDDELLTLLREGRPTGHELNTTGVDMPPKGGNPSYTDEDLIAIVAFLRSINP
jgi:disulfide bond formation protein DsbB